MKILHRSPTRNCEVKLEPMNERKTRWWDYNMHFEMCHEVENLSLALGNQYIMFREIIRKVDHTFGKMGNSITTTSLPTNLICVEQLECVKY